MALLHLRAVWGLPGPPGLPAATPPGCASAPLPPGFTPATATGAWLELWDDGIAWEDDGHPPATDPPCPYARFGIDAVDRDEHREWCNSRKEELAAISIRSWEDVRIRTVLDDAGTRGVYAYEILPLAEPWTLWTSDERVVMSGSILAGPSLLRRYTIRDS